VWCRLSESVDVDNLPGFRSTPDRPHPIPRGFRFAAQEVPFFIPTNILLPTRRDTTRSGTEEPELIGGRGWCWAVHNDEGIGHGRGELSRCRSRTGWLLAIDFTHSLRSWWVALPT
jgi:hypothetical protein